MRTRQAKIELYYWAGTPGRGEFVRLSLEEAGAPYVDVVRTSKKGMQAMMSFLAGERDGALPFASPFVRAGGVVVSQTAAILAFLAPGLGLVPRDERLRAETNMIQLTLADLVAEVHDTHHPLASSLYYEEQKPAAKRRARDFLEHRLPKYLGWLERTLERNRRSRSQWLVGSRLTYADLSAFQVVDGLRYAFPRAMARREPKVPLLIALRDRVAARPHIAAYLASPRRQGFNQLGIFRHYPELDERPPKRRRR